MRCIIMISEEPEKYVSCSVQQKVAGGKRITYTDDMDSAEIWVDPEAARAWCMANDHSQAAILQLDAPVKIRPTEVRRLEPKGRALTGPERAAVKARQEAKDAAEAAESLEAAPKPKARRGRPPKTSSKKSAPPPITPEEQALMALEASEARTGVATRED